jgi:hypothetical protein
MAVVKLKAVRVVTPVPWGGQGLTNTLVIRNHNGAPNGTLTLDTADRVIMAVPAGKPAVIIPFENVAYAEPAGPEAESKPPEPKPAPPPPKPAVSDVVKFTKDAKGNIVEAPKKL